MAPPKKIHAEIESTLLNLKFIQTHDPVFGAGVNFGDKLDITKRPDMFLQHDEEKDLYLIWYKGELAGRMPSANVKNSIPIKLADTGYIHPTIKVKQVEPQSAPSANPTIQAQVSGPTSHVFEPGHGQTGVGGRIR